MVIGIRERQWPTPRTISDVACSMIPISGAENPSATALRTRSRRLRRPSMRACTSAPRQCSGSGLTGSPGTDFKRIVIGLLYQDANSQFPRGIGTSRRRKSRPLRCRGSVVLWASASGTNWLKPRFSIALRRINQFSVQFTMIAQTLIAIVQHSSPGRALTRGTWMSDCRWRNRSSPYNGI